VQGVNVFVASLTMVGRHARRGYVTDDEYRWNDLKAGNPWDKRSMHLEAMCELSAKP
jgi:hypothetical protein